MRALVLLLCVATALSAQRSPFPTNLEIWKRIASYLDLTSGQLDAILEINRPHWAVADELYRSREELREMIFTETARSPLRPAELGRLHVDWEIGRRKLLDAERTSNEASRMLLTEAQLARLKLLEDLTALRPAMDQAISIGLSPSDCVKTDANYLPDSCSPHILPLFNDIVNWRPRSSDYEPATPGTIGISDPLQAHFRFTEAQ